MAAKKIVIVLMGLVLVAVGFHRFSLASVTGSPFTSPISPPLLSATESPFTSPISTPSPTAPSTGEVQAALRHVPETYDIPLHRLRIGDEIIIEHPLTRRTLWEAKVTDRRYPRAYLVETDLDSGQVVDGEEVRRLEREAYLQKYGKLEPELYDRLQALRDGDVIKVSIWLSSVSLMEIWEQVADQHPEAGLESPRPTNGADLKLYEQTKGEMRAAQT